MDFDEDGITILQYCRMKNIEKTNKFFHLALLSAEYVLFGNYLGIFGFSYGKIDQYKNLPLNTRIILLKMALHTEAEWDNMLKFIPKFEKLIVFS